MDVASERQRIRELIRRTGVAIFMTTDREGAHSGRPMLPLFLDNDPHIYFLTHQDSRKVNEVAGRPQVGLGIVGPHLYVFVTGRASCTRDRALIERLWKPTYRAWFPHGTSDHEATVLQVVVERIEYWEPSRNPLARFVHAARALLTGHAVEAEMKTLDGV